MSCGMARFIPFRGKHNSRKSPMDTSKQKGDGGRRRRGQVCAHAQQLHLGSWTTFGGIQSLTRGAHSPLSASSCFPRMWRPFHTHNPDSGQLLLLRLTENLHTHKIHQFLGSIVVSISARHAEDPGSIPGRGMMPLPSTWPRHARRGSRKR